MMNHAYKIANLYKIGRQAVACMVAAVLTFGLSLSVSAQEKSVSGTVKGSDGDGLPGVSVQVKGTSKGVQTDINGAYKIGVGNNATLQFSFLGMNTQEIAVGNKSVIDVTLIDDAKALEEVVVVGYGTVKKKDLTGAVQGVSAKDFNGGVLTNPLQAVQGKVAGLQVTRPSGDPNGGLNIRLRGTGSLLGGSAPLVVIDGIPGGDISSVAPEDIESFDVLKDASAGAIYGARAANGVIMITTKKGKSGRTSVDYNVYGSVQTPSRYMDLLTATELRSAAASLNKKFVDNGADTDWMRELTRDAKVQNHNVAVAGGTDKFNYRASVSYLNQEGIVITSGLERLNFRLNSSMKALNDKLTADFLVSSTATKRNFIGNSGFRGNSSLGAGGDFGSYDVMLYAANFLPTNPVKNADGTYFEVPDFEYYNPVALLNNTSNTGRDNDVSTNIKLNYELAQGLVFGVNGGLVRKNDLRSFYQTKTQKSSQAGGRANRNSEANINQILETTLKYNKAFGNQTLDLLGGYSYQTFDTDGFGAGNSNFITDAFGSNNLGAGEGINNGQGFVYSFRNNEKLISFFGRANYNLLDKYLFTATLRRDGSSKFGADNKWGLFPSVSAAWKISEESFLKGNENINSLKLRLGYGSTGNSEGLSPYRSLSTVAPAGSYVVSPGVFYTGYGPGRNANPNLRWETITTAGAGLDFSLLKNKLSGSLDVYDRQTKDMLYDYPVAVPPNLVNTTRANAASLSNKGLELTLNYDVIDTKGFTWTLSPNFATNRNKVTSLSSADFEIAGGEIKLSPSIFLGRGLSANSTHILKEGLAVGTFFMPKISIENGKFVEVDVDGDGKFSDDKDRTTVGVAQPKFSMGLQSSMTFGSFDFTMMFRGLYGQDVWSLVNTNYAVLSDRFPSNNVLQKALEYNITSATRIGSMFIEKGSFTKLDNATLGYKIPKAGVLKGARIYFTGQNLITISKYSGMDPENVDLGGLTPGIDARSFYPATRTFIAGLNFNF